MKPVQNRPLAKSSSALLLTFLCLSAAPGWATNLYWDSNGATAGAGTAPAGTWGTDAFWSTDSTGQTAPGAWVTTQTAVFSAGTDATGAYTLGVSGTQTAAGVLVEEGNISINAGIVDTGTGNFTIGTGAGSTARVNINSTSRLNTAGKVVLDGGIFYNTNSAGTGGSFINAAKGLEVTANGGTIGYDDQSATNAFAIIYAGTITGTGGTTSAGVGTLTKVGPDEFRAQGAGMANNTFQKLVVKEGAYRLGNVSGANFETAFGAVPAAVLTDAITLDGGQIGTSVSISLSANRGITIGPNGGGFNGIGAGTLTVPGPLSGSGKLTVSGGTGGVTLTNASNTSTFTGSVQVDLGTLTLSQSLNATNFSGAGGTVSVASGKIFTVGSDNTPTLFIGLVSGAGAFTKVGTGTLSTRTEWTNTGTTSINGGSIRYDITAAGLGNTSQVSIGASGTLDMNSITDTIGSVAGAGVIINGANLTLSGNNGSIATYSGSFSGTAAARVLTKNGTGIQVLSGTNDFTSVVLNAGELRPGSNTALSGAGGPTTISVSATAVANASQSAGDTGIGSSSGTIDIPNTIVLNGGAANLKIYATSGNAARFNGIISGVGGLVRDDFGAGTVTINGANTFQGGFKIYSRAISVGNAAAFGTGPLTIGDATTAPANAITFNATVDLSGANAIANAVTFNQNFTTTGDNLELTSNLALGANRTVTTSNAAGKVTTLSGILSGAGGLNKAGAGTLVLPGASTFGGATSVDAGTLLVNGSLTGTASVSVTGTLGGSGSIVPVSAGGISLTATGRLAPGPSGGTGTLSATLSGGGTLSIGTGVAATTSQALAFDLDTPATSDQIAITGGALDIGGGGLEFDDFSFNALGGFGQGTYTLFAGDTAIVGTLGTVIDGTVGGLPAQLQLADGNTDVVLAVVPEPGSAALLLGGLGLLTTRRRKR